MRVLTILFSLAAVAGAQTVEDSVLVVRIATERPVAGRIEKQLFTASALVVGKGGLLLAAGFHLQKSTDPNEPVRVSAVGPQGRVYQAKLIGGDEELGCTFFRLAGEKLPAPVTLDAAAVVRPGDKVFLLGRHGALMEYAPRRIAATVDAATRGPDVLYALRETRHQWVGSVAVTPTGKLVGFVDTRDTVPVGSGAAMGVGAKTLVVVSARSYADAARTPVREVARRAWLGVNLSPFDADREAFFSVKENWTGALVTGVAPGSPAAQAGIQLHDLLQTIGPARIHFERQTEWASMLRAVQRLPLGVAMKCKVVRFTRRADGEYTSQPMILTMTLRARPLDFADAPETEIKDLGFKVKPLTQDIRPTLKIAPGMDGVVVTRTARASPAQLARLLEGDLIQKVDGQDVKDVAGLLALLAEARTEKRPKVVLFVRRGTGTLFVALATNW